MIAVDASVGVKWFLQESGSEIARSLLKDAAGSMVAPDLFAIEVTAALVRTANIDKPTAPAMLSHIADLGTLLESRTVELHRSTVEQIELAGKLAVDLGHPLKDCIYLALAIDLACPLMTADARFAERVRDLCGEVRVLAVE